MESGMLEKMVCKYSQVQGSRAQRKLVVFNLQDVQEKFDQVGVQMDEWKSIFVQGVVQDGGFPAI